MASLRLGLLLKDKPFELLLWLLAVTGDGGHQNIYYIIIMDPKVFGDVSGYSQVYTLLLF